MRRSVYFNYAGVARIPFDLFLGLMKFIVDYYFFGPPRVILKYDTYIPLLSEELAKLLSCDSGELAYIKNTTEGIILAAETLPLVAGDEILVMQCEYPANFIPWLKKRKDGMDVRIIEGNGSEASFH